VERRTSGAEIADQLRNSVKRAKSQSDLASAVLMVADVLEQEGSRHADLPTVGELVEATRVFDRARRFVNFLAQA